MSINRYTWEGEVTRVVDGDTFDLELQLGFGIAISDRFRLAGVDTPEIRGEERPDGLAAVDFVHDWLADARLIAVDRLPLTVRTHKSRGKHGRWVAEIFNLKGESLASALLANGLAEAVDW